MSELRDVDTTLDTVEPPTMSPPAHDEEEPARSGRWWRGLTGSLAMGLAVLAVIFVGGELIALARGTEGPGALPVFGHVAGAALALGAQVVVDRRRGPAAGVAAAVVLLVIAAVLWFFWWS
ncbi:hypothetical protein ABZ863_14210 [Saccharomonospora sp. NPDC046836]|uniref:hypothetical protein n=1 Tax=Saccharomonospora sp. NPDC046836 TaxID=3156921 RepID=UPI00340BD759